MSNLEECNALVLEFHVAHRIISNPGRVFSGADLLRFRQLPPPEQAYFTFLVAPILDPHVSRTTTVSEPDASGHRTVSYDPPYPEPCACGCAVFVDHQRNGARCSRCLHAWWPWVHSESANRRTLRRLSEPLIDSVNRSDMGYAIERLEWKSQVTGYSPPKSDTPSVNPYLGDLLYEAEKRQERLE